jgi:hypothetical protein
VRWDSKFALKEVIEHRRNELSSTMMSLLDGPPGAFELPEDVLAAMIELEDLESEFKFWLDNPPDSDEPDLGVRAPLKPPPHLNSAAIALPEPDQQNAKGGN